MAVNFEHSHSDGVIWTRMLREVSWRPPPLFNCDGFGKGRRGRGEAGGGGDLVLGIPGVPRFPSKSFVFLRVDAFRRTVDDIWKRALVIRVKERTGP